MKDEPLPSSRDFVSRSDGNESEQSPRGANAAIRQSALQVNISVLPLRMYGSEKLSNTADVCEMDESLTTALV